MQNLIERGKIMSIWQKLFGMKRPQNLENIGRNDICWCGSGLKYKRCHLSADSEIKASQRSAKLKAQKAAHGLY
ncbi:SEC-C metal-binding domain-containing protein [candidate division CSSED10-310 bacterium]|uniref:SEC-C metal-binding domain-containing protein n=1 Tax=candidate division CSSED10-310 bacterium TaxID=2855610 RepID=A0ABV6YW42_UNCC1